MEFLVTPPDGVGRHAGFQFCADRPTQRSGLDAFSGYFVDWIDRTTDRGLRLTRVDAGAFVEIDRPFLSQTTPACEEAVDENPVAVQVTVLTVDRECFCSGDGDDEEGAQVPDVVSALARESQEREVGGVEHQLDAHEHHQRVAADQHAQHAEAEQRRGQDQIVRRGDGLNHG